MNEFQRKVLLYLNIKESDLPDLTKKVTFDDLESPYVFLDMEKARDRILKAVDNNEKIMVYGDYDCDGISATSILVKMFQILNRKVGYYIPSRYIDGYGINVNRAKQIIAKGTIKDNSPII
jgi:single-stranded-DNA-specific exonuclease